jgi:hypothetical protein
MGKSHLEQCVKGVFGLDVQIRTDDGRFLKLKFSEKSLDPHADVVHVNVSGACPPFHNIGNAGRR